MEMTRKELEKRASWLNFLIEVCQKNDSDKVKEFKTYTRKHKIYLNWGELFTSNAFTKEYIASNINQFLTGAGEVITALKESWQGNDDGNFGREGIPIPGTPCFSYNPLSQKFSFINAGTDFEKNLDDYGRYYIMDFLLNEDIRKLRLCKNCERLFFVVHGKRRTCSDECGRQNNYKKVSAKKDKEYDRLKAQKSYYKNLRPKWTKARLAKKWKIEGVDKKYIKKLLN